jgi:hypothetical protein
MLKSNILDNIVYGAHASLPRQENNPVPFEIDYVKTKCPLYENYNCINTTKIVDIKDDLMLLIEDAFPVPANRHHCQLYADKDKKFVWVNFKKTGLVESAYYIPYQQGLEIIYKHASSNEQIDEIIKILKKVKVKTVPHFEKGRWVK